MSIQIICPQESGSQNTRERTSEYGCRISQRVIDRVARNTEENPEALLELVKQQRETRLKQEKEIVYEEVTLRVPKLVMDLLREHERIISMKVAEYLERAISTMVKAEVDANEQFNPQAEETHSEVKALLDLILEDQ